MSGSTPFPSQDGIENARMGLSQAASQAKADTTGNVHASKLRDQPPAPAPDQLTDTQPPGRPQPQDPIQGPETPAVDSPEVDSIDAESDMRAYMSSAVSESLRRKALRKWFHLPGFNHRDGLDDYDEDYRTFNPLGDMVTAHLRHQMQRLADRSDAPSAKAPGQKAAPGPRALPAEGRSAPAANKARHVQASSHEKAWNVGRGPAVSGADVSAGDASPETTLLWDAARCARGRGALSGCIRCSEACSGGAILFDAQGLQIRLERCSGQGACAAVCPTGAIRPAVNEITAMLKEVRALADQGQKGLNVVFCSARTPAESLQGLKDRLPEPILAFYSRLPAAPGLEVWLAALAMGACRVIVLGDPPHAVQKDQLRLARAILTGLNLDGYARLLGPDSPAIEERINRSFSLQPLEPAAWQPAEDKRALLWQAIDHLQEQFPGPLLQVPLYPGAPLGEVRLNPALCTLCMACVGACPTGALLHGAEHPQVRFRERDCIQCGMCCRVCPEQAVTLAPRICYDRELTRSARVIHQAEPLGCSICGAPFASREMVDTIARKLSAHWMYQDPSARDRLRMCRDCRIRSIYAGRQKPGGGAKGGEK